MKTLIQQLQDGEIAIYNNGSVKDLKRVLKIAFPKKDRSGLFTYYYSLDNYLYGKDEIKIPAYPVAEFIKELNNQTTRSMKRIARTQAQSIIDVACSNWKDRLVENWAKEMLIQGYVEITDEFYQNMRKACTKEQNELFDKIFGKDEPEYKIGEWVTFMPEKGLKTPAWDRQITLPIDSIHGDSLHFSSEDLKLYANHYKDWTDGGGNIKQAFRKATPEEIKKAQSYPDGTPCLVRDHNDESWKLAYANGNGEFYKESSKSGNVHEWEYHMKLDMYNLPVND